VVRVVHVAAAALLVFALALAGCGGEGPKFRASDVTGSSFGRELALTDHNGKARTLPTFAARSSCCSSDTRSARRLPDDPRDARGGEEAAGPDGDKVQVLFVTIDPERDKPELLLPYVTAFDPSFLGLYGDADATARTAKEFKIIYQKQPGATPQTYTMDHSAGTFVFDTEGRLRLYVGHGQDADLFAHDLRELLRMTKP
jgi:protein SCO1/2